MNPFVLSQLQHAHGKPIIKLLRIMKITAILVTVFCLHVYAKGYTQAVTISAKNAPLEKIFGEIEKQTGYGFVYQWELLQKAKPVDLEVKQVTLKEVLDLCFKDQPLSYSIVDKTIVVTQKEEKKNNATDNFLIDVKGKVINEKGEPVAGASVRIKGTDKGTSTGENGEFILSAIDANAVLIISGTNIETLEVRVAGKTSLPTLTVKTKVTEGEQVIINTGYAKVSGERFVGSYSQLSNAEYERRAGMDILTRLDGTVTGVLFDKKTGGNLLDNGKIQIRGISTLTRLSQSANSAPLVIVDNFPFKQDLNSINPNDIDNITILKDAAATSIWGAQAGNGVIVITTKKGKYGQPLRISVTSNITIQSKPNLYYYPQMSIPDFVEAEIFLFGKGQYNSNLNNTSTWPVVSSVVELLSKRSSGKISALDSANQIDAYKGMDLRRDLDKYVYRNAISQQHYINFSGGSELFNYSFSAGYNHSLNNVRGSKPDDQFSINANTGFRPIKNLEITSGISYSQSTQRSTSFSLPNKTYLYAQLADAQGNSLALPNRYRISYIDTAGRGKLLDWRFRPLDEIGLADINNSSKLILLNIGITYKFTDWLTSSVTYQYSNQLQSDRNYHNPETYFTRDLINQFTNLSQTDPSRINPVPLGGILDLANGQSESQNARGQLNFNKNFGIRHSLTAMVAGEISENKGTGNTSRFYGYNSDFDTYKSAIDYLTPFPLYGAYAGNQQIPNGSQVFPATHDRIVSFIANANYTYNGLYTFYASARKDGSNLFGVNTNRKWKPLWSTGASWDISKENFYGIRSWLPTLRLRLSYGYSGNRGNVSGLPTISYSTVLSSLANQTLAFPNDPPNPDLKWEKVGILNAGVDFAFLKKRISGSLDIWQKRSTDIISYTPLAPSTGNTDFVVNAASLKGNGFDIRLNTTNLEVGDFSWLTTIGLSHVKTIVTKLYNSAHRANDFVAYGLNAAEGQLAYGIASYKWEGLDPMTGDPRGYFNKQISTDYNAIFNDSIGNQIFNGSAIPMYYGNMMNSFAWKGFKLSANITYRFDFYFRKPTISYVNLANNWQGNADYALRWQKPGDEKNTSVPSFTYPLNSNRDLFYQFSEVNIFRGDNIKLNDIQLQYSWDKKNFGKMPFKNLQLYIYINNLNLILWRKNKSGLDPDFTDVSNFVAPTAKTITLGLKIGL